MFVRKEKQLTKKTKSIKQLQQSRKKTTNARKKTIRLNQLRWLRGAASEQLPLTLNTASALKRLYLSASVKLTTEQTFSLLPLLLVAQQQRWYEPSYGPPTYLLALIPALNFLFLFSFVRFASWPVVYGAMALPTCLFIVLPRAYCLLWLACWALVALLIFWLTLEAIYIFPWLCIKPRSWPEVSSKYGRTLLLVGSLDRWAANVPAAKRLASRRKLDVAFSALLLISFFLFC